MNKRIIALFIALFMLGTVYGLTGYRAGSQQRLVPSQIVFASAGNNMTAAKAEPAEQETTETIHREDTAGTAAAQDRIYCLASISKMYSTAAVMRLVDEGKVELDAPVTEYLPDFRMKDGRYKDITVRMLMNHTLGISMGNGTNDYLYDDADSWLHDNILDFASGLRFKADPGEYACYNNWGFILLEQITENVSGMSYTDYVRENIAAKIGAEHTGTAWSLYKGETGGEQVSLWQGSMPVEYPYEMAAGPGGIYATAPDVANFGAAFFTGNDVLLSDGAKAQMSTRWNDDDSYEGYGLGWDFVEQVRYEKENIKVMGKGGDQPYMHSFLLVAPDEQISAAVLTAGNDSSECAQLMAQALMDVVLEERGKQISDPAPPEPVMTDTVPESFEKYEGLYCVGGLYSTGICSITFDDSFMYRDSLSTERSSPETYRYTGDGSFVKVNDSGRMTADREIISFVEKDGKIYIRTDMTSIYPGLGSMADSMYTGEKMEDNPVSDSVQQSWDELSRTYFVKYDEKWSSQHYDYPFYRIATDAAFPGYLLVKSGIGVTLAEKMTDEHTARFFTTIPSSANRDLYDIDVTGHTYADGTVSVSLELSDGTRCRSVDTLPVFTSEVSVIPLDSGEAAWYRIGDDMSGKSIIAERPEKSAIYVYNKFRELIYSTHMKNTTGVIDLPPDGYIVFIGETGDSVEIFR